MSLFYENFSLKFIQQGVLDNHWWSKREELFKMGWW